MISKCTDVANFFEQSTTQRIIDIQFNQKTRFFIKLQFVFYLFGFFIPYVYNCLYLIDQQDSRNQTSQLNKEVYIICCITQAFFLVLELPEIYFIGIWKYLKDGYNFFDFALPSFFVAHMCIRYKYGKPDQYDWLRLVDNIVEILIIIGSMIKLLQYIRYQDDFAQFVQIFIKINKQLVSFILMFFFLVTAFCLIQFILSGKVEDEEVYSGIQPFLVMFIQTIRISIGDLKVVGYSNWADDPQANADKPQYKSITGQFVSYIVWGFWLLNIYLIQIVMLNLLIAQVSQIYENVMSQRTTSIYQERAELNLRVYEQFYFFGFKNEFVALIIQTPLQNEEDSIFDDFTTFSKRVKKSTQETVNKLESRIDSKIDNLQTNLKQQNINIQQQNSDLNQKISNIEQTMKQILSSLEKKIIQ